MKNKSFTYLFLGTVTLAGLTACANSNNAVLERTFALVPQHKTSQKPPQSDPFLGSPPQRAAATQARIADNLNNQYRKTQSL